MLFLDFYIHRKYLLMFLVREISFKYHCTY